MKAEALLALYERVVDAPDAIARLRRFVLDLAVHGKLVEHDAADEPASKLLGRITTEHARLVESGSIKEPRNAQRIDRSELPFHAPKHWAWCRLIELARVSYGFAFESARFNGEKRGMPLIRIRDISRADTEAYYDGDFDPVYLVRHGDYLIGMDGDFNLRRWSGGDALLNQRVLRINDWRCGVAPGFVRLPLQMVLSHVHGSTSQTTVKHLSAKQVNGIEVPLPPLDEQHRIVAKVDELMALLDRLDAARSARETTRSSLTAASLTRLTAPDTDPGTLRTYARFSLDALPALTARADQIKQLRQAILDLAVRGKLVSQLSSEGSAKKFSAAASGSAPFAIPLSWSWNYLADLAVLINGDRSKSYPNRAEYQPQGVAWINTGHIQPDGSLSLSSMHYISREKFNSLRSGKIHRGDLLYCLRGATFGKTGFVAPFEEGAIASSLMIVRVGEHLSQRFAYLVLTSPLGRHQLLRFDNGTAQPNLSSSNVGKYHIPLPTLAEQHRIVAKVDELNSLCNRLEAALQEADSTRARLLEALLHEALEPNVTVAA